MPVHELLCVVVNYRRPADTVRLARQLLALGVPPGAVVLVDNSRDIEARDVPPGARVLALDNVGYAGAVNRAFARFGRGPDTALLVMTHETVWLTGGPARLLSTLESRPRVAAAGPVLVDSNVPGSPAFAGVVGRLPEGRRAFVPADRPVGVRDVDSLDGACWLISGRALAEIGPLREDYFLYWEETEWCDRAKAMGWTILVDGDCRVSQESAWASASTTYYMARNRLLASRDRGRRVKAGKLLNGTLRFAYHALHPAGPSRARGRAGLAGIASGLANRRGPRDG